jgi:hypothetical protein
MSIAKKLLELTNKIKIALLDSSPNQLPIGNSTFYRYEGGISAALVYVPGGEIICVAGLGLAAASLRTWHEGTASFNCSPFHT